MSYVMVIETSGHRQTHKLSLSPSKSITVGRAWQNDVIVDDEYVDASHLHVTLKDDGAIQVSDLGTRNGSRLRKQRIVDEATYTVGSPIVIGDSSISIHDTNAVVVPAQKLDSAHVASRLFSSFAWVVIAVLAAATGLVGSAYFTSASEATSEALSEQILGAGLLAIVWCLLASFVGKLFRHRMYLKLHWLLSCFIIVAVPVVTLVVDVLRFNLDSGVSEIALVNGSSALLILLFAYGTLSLSTRLAFKKKLAGASLLALMPLFFSVITPMLVEEHDRWTYVAGVQRVNQPPSLFFAKPISLQEHIRKTDDLFAELDAEVEAEASNSLNVKDLNDTRDDVVQISEMN